MDNSQAQIGISPKNPRILRFFMYGTPGFNHLGLHSPRSFAHSTSAGRVPYSGLLVGEVDVIVNHRWLDAQLRY